MVRADYLTPHELRHLCAVLASPAAIALDASGNDLQASLKTSISTGPLSVRVQRNKELAVWRAMPLL